MKLILGHILSPAAVWLVVERLAKISEKSLGTRPLERTAAGDKIRLLILYHNRISTTSSYTLIVGLLILGATLVCRCPL